MTPEIDLLGAIIKESAVALNKFGKKKRVTKANGYAAQPGTGPEDEFCKTCAHYRRTMTHAKSYPKCFLRERFWTHGPGSDIRAKSPACRHWEKKVEDSEK